MNITLKRYAHGDDSTAGMILVNGSFQCYTLEDERREKKVPGETRIPEGRYRILLREAGGMHQRYKRRFPWHRGMLHLQDVPNFTWIYIHPGNTDDHTEGCILPGYIANHSGGENTVARSVEAYSDLYHLILLAIFERGEEVWLTVE